MKIADKVKAAHKETVDIAAKRRAISNARRKAYTKTKRVEAAHHNARTYEDSMYVTDPNLRNI